MATHMNRDMIAQILWAIFGDARQFFSKCATTRDFSDPDNLPQSHLQAVHCILASRVRLVLMDYPSELLAHPPREKGAASSGGGAVVEAAEIEPEAVKHKVITGANPTTIAMIGNALTPPTI
jgi:hypothetical protein